MQHFFLEDVVRMLNYMPPLPEPEKKKKKKNKQKDEPAGEADNIDGANDTEDSLAVSENMLQCDDEYGPEVKKALSRMSEREIPLDIIEVRVHFLIFQIRFFSSCYLRILTLMVVPAPY